MPEQIFDKEKREHIHAEVAGAGFVEAVNYINILEYLAKAAKTYLGNSTPANALPLDVALDAVDRMRE